MHDGATAQAIGATYTLNTSTNPSRGAAVFWSATDGFGQVAISLGNWILVTTRGFEDDRLTTTYAWFTTVSAGKHYMGWTPTP